MTCGATRAFALLALALAAPAAAETPAEVAARYGLAGELLVAKGDTVLLDRGFGPIAPGGTAQHRAGETWRLASITKQIVAAMLLKQDASVPLAVSLDEPLPDLSNPAHPADPSETVMHNLAGLTLRQLLTHHTGLANPDESAEGRGGVPSFYLKRTPDWKYCLAKPARPGAPFAYNNCDYIVAGAGLVDFLSDEIDTFPGTHFARPAEVGILGFVGVKPEPHFELGSYGTAGGLIGTARAVYDFDRALMTGKLLPPDKLAALWTPEGHGSYQALGVWVFPGQIKGCAAPKRIVQRDGEIYGVQARNFILPDDGIVVVVFTNRSADDFAIGEVWQGKGFAYDLLSAAACG